MAEQLTDAELVERLRAALEQSKRDGKQLGKTIDYLTGIMTGTVLLGADDAFGMLQALTEHLVEANEINVDQAERVYAGLDRQRADRDRLGEQVKRAYELADRWDNALATDRAPARKLRAVLDGTEAP